VVAPVNVLIDLHERDWALTVQSAQHRNRDSVVAADDDRKRTCGKNLANRRFGAAVMRLEVGWSAHTSPQSTERIDLPS